MSRTDSRPPPTDASTAAWLAILALSAAGTAIGARAAPRWLLAAALAATLFKGHLVVDHFMGLRRVRARWRALLGAWLLVLGLLIGLPLLWR